MRRSSHDELVRIVFSVMLSALRSFNRGFLTRKASILLYEEKWLICSSCRKATKRLWVVALLTVSPDQILSERVILNQIVGSLTEDGEGDPANKLLVV
jgi:hypothetical protein